MKLTLGLVGDYRPEVTSHVAIPRAIELAAAQLGLEAQSVWLATPKVEAEGESLLEGFDALWCVPASPYASMEGALTAIRFAREQGKPFLGTCGGFQHAVIEFARAVAGLQQADHAESNPDSDELVITPLTCAVNEQTHTFLLRPGSRAASIYGQEKITEQYGFCSYGINDRYLETLVAKGLVVSGVAEDSGEPRIIELPTHPFFLATLYQPERSALKQVSHPLALAWLRAATPARALP